MPTHTATGRFTYAKWEEHAAGPDDVLPRLAQASVVNSFSGGIEAAETVCTYAIAYLTAATGTFTGLELITGSLDGRGGGFAVEERGSFHEDGTTQCTFEVVPGSGTGALTGLRGSGGFVHRQGETSVPYTFTYELD
ncbi:uncharacterized protein DUF3224 [Streptomyces sp. 3211.6]|uniref:DUF3224 domain-containing protein n=1 Tax=Streptomyces TaxID=1883 RepID=UPI0009A49CAB|nr:MULTISPECIES: DUF3224 domain-containing protein [Streptomyces]RKT04455.1 uncharacterized protein DUF3224 [Streptomyces sp. 3211.6]RPF40339.1 uncharacterized protein DUF3224 [Streptomyces sp. Ag109_G2-6]